MTYVRKQGSLTLSESTNCHQFSFLLLLQISPCQALANLILPQFSLSSPNPLPQEMLGMGGMWGQINLENNCKVSISEYPVGESYFCSRGWEGTEECRLQPQCCQGTGTHGARAWHRATGPCTWSRAAGPCTWSRAFVQSQLSANCSWGTANFLGAEEVLQGLLATAVFLPPLK